MHETKIVVGRIHIDEWGVRDIACPLSQVGESKAYTTRPEQHREEEGAKESASWGSPQRKY
jgi:hypothetical protein